MRINIACYKCTNHYFTEHQCRTKTIMVMEELVSHEHKVEISLDELPNGEENHTSTVCIQAIERIPAGSMLKIRGTLEGHDILVLIDSGNLHSFFNKNATKWIKNKVI